MISLRNLLILAMILNLQGCWAVFIPGSVVGSVTDSITGAEGANCVGESAKVGDKIRIQNGGVGIVQSLSGTSTRCSDPSMPIRAKIAYNTNPPGAVAAVAPLSKLTLALPVGWAQNSLTPEFKSAHGLVYAINRTADIGLLLSATPREGISDFETFTNTRRALQANQLTEVQQSELMKVEVNGQPALRFSVTGVGKSGIRFTYLTTVVEGRSEIALLNTWTSAANFASQRSAMELMSNQITGL